MKEHTDVSRVRRRQHSAEFMAQVVNACMQPGISVAAVALRHQLNANLLHRWVATQEEQNKAAPAREAMPIAPPPFVPLQLPLPDSPFATQEIVIEVRRGGATAAIRWPSSAAADCAAWLQGWLR